MGLPAALYAASVEGDGSEIVVRLFVVFAVMLIAGKASGEVFERIGQPAVVGELIAGVLLGGSVLGIIPTAEGDALTEVVRLFAEIGVVVLLFEIGLETDMRQLFRVGLGASTVAVVGVTVPMLLGIGFWLSPLAPTEFGIAERTTTAIFIGATLTATSVGITGRVLRDLRAIHSTEARLIIGAAVVDDVLGLVLLGLVSTLVAGGAVSAVSVGRSLGLAFGFLVAAIGIGLLVAPRIFDLIDRMRVRGVLLVAAFAFLMMLAALADMVGSAMIVGAFAAGIILSGTNQFDIVGERIKPVADIFTPVFFLSIGAHFDVRLLNPLDPENMGVLAAGAVLFAIAVGGKVVAGWSVPWRKFNRVAVGVGMIPRGEVGLIFANLGLASGVLSTELFGVILVMVVGTTFIAPPLLKWTFARGGITVPDRESAAAAQPEALGPGAPSALAVDTPVAEPPPPADGAP